MIGADSIATTRTAVLRMVTGSAVGKAGAIFALALALSAIVTHLSLALSSEYGRLSVPPLYDDVSYFVAAARWLSEAATLSYWSDLYAMLDQHSPFTTLIAAIGLAMVPHGYAGPYLV